jgi:GGDEF domain-containing protein
MLLAVLATLTAQPAAAAPVPVLVLDSAQQQADLVPALEVLLDQDGALALDQLEQQADLPFQPAEAGKRYPLGKGSLWLRFDAIALNNEVSWRLTVPLAGVDDVRLYYRDPTGQLVSQLAGDSRPMSSWPQPGRYPVFSLAPGGVSKTRYYLQVRHARVPFSVMPRVFSDARLVQASQTEHMLLGIYFGLAALVVALALINAVAYRDWGFGSYAIYIALFALAQASYTGIAQLYLWPRLSDPGMVTVLLLPAAAASALWFVRTVTAPRRFSPPLDRLLLLLVLLLALSGVADAFLVSQASFYVICALIAAGMLALLTTISVTLAAGDLHTRWIAAGFVPILLATAFPLLRNVGLTGSGLLSDYALLIGSALEAPILFYGLLRRVAQRRSVSARATGLETSDPLTGLDAPALFAGKLRQSMTTAGRYRLPFAALVVQLANHAALQKSHGRETADRAIVMSAARIRSIAQPTDSLARLGDAQFALLLEGPLSAADATDIATRILAAGLRASSRLPGAEPLQFHIAVGHVDGQTGLAPDGSDGWLARLQQAAASMNDGSRKAIRLVRP